MKQPISGVILAGGLNSRFSGKEKAFIKIDGKSMIEHIYDLFSRLFREIIIVTNKPELYTDFDALLVTDIPIQRCSLGGIYTGLFWCGFPNAFFTACDMPFLNQGLVEAILDESKPNIDIIVPKTEAGFEPFCALYSKRCMNVMKENLEKEILSIRGVFDRVKTKTLSEAFCRRHDGELASFVNINSPGEL